MEHRTLRAKSISMFGTALLLCTADSAAQTRAQRGADLAQHLCASCHLMPGSQHTSVTAGIPTFTAIANKPGQTGRHIELVLMKPHSPMPDVQLTIREIENILHLLQTLRSDQSAPPLISPLDADPKSTPPKPS